MNNSQGVVRSYVDMKEKLEESSLENSERQIEGLEAGKVRSDSRSSGHTDGENNTDGEGHSTARTQTRDLVLTSVMSHPQSDTALEKCPTGPKNMSIDEEGKIVVNWTSRKDPENPKNWPRRKKIFNVIVISSMTFLCPLCSAMFVSPFETIQLTIVARSSADCRKFSHLTDPCGVLRLSVFTRLRRWSACPCTNERNLRTKTDIYSRLQCFCSDPNSLRTG